MDKELDYFLVKRYQNIFKNRHGNMKETAMCWGFECGNGWFNLINHACFLIESHINNIVSGNEFSKSMMEKIDRKEDLEERVMERYRNGNYEQDIVPLFIADQVKEKFGTLRFYYTGGDDYIDGIIAMTQFLSGSICEECGEKGKLRNNNWLRVLCDKHNNNSNNEELDKILIVEGSIINALDFGKKIDILVEKVISEKEFEGIECIDHEPLSEVAICHYNIKLCENNFFPYYDAIKIDMENIK
jgi:hypothetical protein